MDVAQEKDEDLLDLPASKLSSQENDFVFRMAGVTAGFTADQLCRIDQIWERFYWAIGQTKEPVE